MSSNDIAEEESRLMCCASCGIAELDDIELKPCDGCDLVRYCGDDCKEDHRPEHKEACKERAAELHDEILFRQPESSHMGDCPICCVPLPIDLRQSSFYSCCSKIICKGCAYANKLRQLQENMPRICPFCRDPIPKTQEEIDKNFTKRIAVNDPVALFQFAKHNLYVLGQRGVRNNGDYDEAFKYLTKAAELGNADAHFNLSHMYRDGGRVEKDEKKQVYHLEEAAIAGHLTARHNLGVYEGQNGRMERAGKHFIIAANLGYDLSMQMLKDGYKAGDISKEDYAATLRAHHAAIVATRSPQRKEAEKAKYG